MTQDDLGAMIFGGIIGAALASPKPEEKKELNEYRHFKQQIALRQQKIGELTSLPKLVNKPHIYYAFIESANMFLAGFNRGSVVLCSAIIETILKEKYGNQKFYNLIEEAKNKQLLTNSDIHYLHGIRLERNDFAHNVLREVTEEDALLIIKITNKILDKFN